MTLFEFILVMVSLVLAIGITHLLQGVAGTMHRREDVVLDWVPLTWAIYLFVLAALHWWSLWDMREVAWTFPAFFFVLLPPTLLYLAVSLLVSGGLGTTSRSMSADFMRIRAPFFAVLLTWAPLVWWDGAILGTEPVWNSLRAIQVVTGLVLLLGLISTKRRVQQLVAAVSLGSLLFVGFILRLLPGAFGPS